MSSHFLCESIEDYIIERQNAEATLFNRSLQFAAALSVTKFITIITFILVTLCSAS
jgi:hypothetical protein